MPLRMIFVRVHCPLVGQFSLVSRPLVRNGESEPSARSKAQANPSQNSHREYHDSKQRGGIYNKRKKDSDLSHFKR